MPSALNAVVRHFMFANYEGICLLLNSIIHELKFKLEIALGTKSGCHLSKY